MNRLLNIIEDLDKKPVSTAIDEVYTGKLTIR